MKAVFLAFMLLVASVASAQEPAFPQRGVETIDFLVARFPELATGDDDARRTLTKSIIEQMVCDFPTDGYTWKSADPTRPPSKDAIGRQLGGRLFIWDWQNGATRQRAVQAGQPGHDVTGQHPIQVGCVQHTGPVVPPGTPPPAPPTEPSDDLAELIAEFRAARAEILARDERIYADLTAQVTAVKVSLEEHRVEARKTRNAVLSFLGNWRNLATIAGGIVAGVAGSR